MIRCFCHKGTGCPDAVQYVKHWRMRELLGIFGNLYAGDFCRVQKAAVEIGITDKSDIKFFVNRKRHIFQG